MPAAIGTVPGEVEKLEEELDPVLPGSEQLILQHNLAIETSGVLLIECALLQQSGRFVS